MTAMWTHATLRAATGGILRKPFSATGVSIDTRTLKPGDLFVALVGEGRDGLDFVAAALAKGAGGAMVHRLPDDVPDDAKLLQVVDTLASMTDLARYARARFQGRLAAITGSVGKTTTKEMLRRICTAHGKTWAAEASHNNHWGVPLTLARLSPKAQYCVAEIGMNHIGEIAPLARLARPHVGVITRIAPAHIGYLGSIEAIADEKASLHDGLEPGGIMVLPADDAMLARLLTVCAGTDTIRFGLADTAAARLLGTEQDADGTTLDADILGTPVRTRIGAPGTHMALNAVAALAAAVAMGIDAVSAAAALEGFTPMAGRGGRRRITVAGGSALLLDESYNASSAAMRAAFSVLALQPGQRHIAVLGDMLELGDHAAAEHAGLAADIAAHADLVFTCGPQMRALFDALPAHRRGAHAADSATLAPVVVQALRDGDAVLVKGSLGSRMQTIVRALAPEEAGPT